MYAYVWTHWTDLLGLDMKCTVHVFHIGGVLLVGLIWHVSNNACIDGYSRECAEENKEIEMQVRDCQE